MSSIRPDLPYRESYRGVSLYTPDRTRCSADLSDNTNMFGVPPAALAVLTAGAPASVTRYPSLYTPELKVAIAAYIGVAPECIVTGCGSDDVLDSALRAFAEPGDAVVMSTPSFAMIPLLSRMNGLHCTELPFDSDLQPNVPDLLAARARITYTCSPNNPTGTVVREELIEQLVAGVDGLLIVDEAYVEFSDRSWAERASQERSMLVVRTLSKAFGLAGLRIGYGVGRPETVTEVEKSVGPYKVNSLAERAAVAALTQDLPWVREQVQSARDNRERLAAELARIGVRTEKSESNFVLAHVPDAERVATRLRSVDIAVRPFAGLPGLGDCIRISVGPWELMQRLLSALPEAMA